MTENMFKNNNDKKLEKMRYKCEPCIEEFKLQNCCFDHSPPEILVKSQVSVV